MHVHVLGVPHLLQGRLQVFVARGDLDEPTASWCHLVQNSDHGDEWNASTFLAPR